MLTGLDVEKQSFECRSPPAKFSQPWASDLVASLKEQFSEISNGLIDIKKSVKKDIKGLERSLNDRIAEVKDVALKAIEKTEAIAIEVREVRADIDLVKRENKLIKQSENELKQKCTDLECYSRRENIVVHGVTEVPQESNKQCIEAMKGFFMKVLKVDAENMYFQRCHRLPGKRNAPRPIIVRFRDYGDRTLIWSKIGDIPKKTKQFMCEDFPKEVVANREQLLPIFWKARQTVGKENVTLKNDCLTISGKKYRVDNLKELEGQLNPRAFCRVQSEEVLVFGGCFSDYEPLSNWGKCPVIHNGTTYPTLEHTFIHAKCIANNDVTSAKAVLTSTEAYQAKQIADKLRIKQNKWDNKTSEQVMADLLKSKFTPGSNLATELLNTKKLYLAESGRSDPYACGLPMTHKDILDRDLHPGKNRLGHLLMELRAELSK